MSRVIRAAPRQLSIFGYGRRIRIRPGMCFAEASLYFLLLLRHFLSIFNIEKGVENSVPFIPVHENVSDLVRYVYDWHFLLDGL